MRMSFTGLKARGLGVGAAVVLLYPGGSRAGTGPWSVPVPPLSCGLVDIFSGVISPCDSDADAYEFIWMILGDLSGAVFEYKA